MQTRKLTAKMSDAREEEIPRSPVAFNVHAVRNAIQKLDTTAMKVIAIERAI